MSNVTMLPFIDIAAQQKQIGNGIVDALIKVLQHGQFILGPEVVLLENRLAAHSGARHVVSCANGTDAIILVMMAEDIGPGDAVIVPAFTFVATAEAVALRGATPIFADVDPLTFNIDPDSVVRAIAEARRLSLRPRMVIAVDLFGLPAKYDSLRDLTRSEGMLLVADAAQSFGATYNGIQVGRLADYTTTSFFPTKPLSCYGDGGAIFCDDSIRSERLRSLRMHGKGKDKYDNVRIGLNSRLDTIQAAVLIEKLAVFDWEIEARAKIAEQYSAMLSDLVQVQHKPNNCTSVWAQYTIVIPSKIDRDCIQTHMQSHGIPTTVYYPIPLNRQTGYRHFPKDPSGTPSAEALARTVLSLPMHPYLDTETQSRITDALRDGIKAQC